MDHGERAPLSEGETAIGHQLTLRITIIGSCKQGELVGEEFTDIAFHAVFF